MIKVALPLREGGRQLSVLKQKFIEVFLSITPITIIVILLSLTVVPLSFDALGRFFIGALLIGLGLTFFLIGVDKAIAPLGSEVSEAITKTNKLWVVIITAIMLGFFISVAEPGLIIFGQQVENVSGGVFTGTTLLFVVSIGLGMFLAISFIRILYNISFRLLLSVMYGAIFLFALLAEPEFVVIAFDASGATTGVMAVPFILALAYGISRLKKDSRSSEDDSFGTIAIVSVGAILSVLVMNLFVNNLDFSNETFTAAPNHDGIFGTFIEMLSDVAIEGTLSILPIFLIFIILQLIAPSKQVQPVKRMLRGFLLSTIGLILFLLGANAGFMDVGSHIGEGLASNDQPFLMILIAFVIGVAAILTEPAVHVLTQQIEDVTSGYVSRSVVLVTLSIGVGLAISLAVLRVFIEPLQIWHYLLPGYGAALILMHFIPKIFVGIAFDAGGVATGPMTATFTLAFVQGAAYATEGADVILDGFGMIAMVALTPIITLEALGLIYKIKSRKSEVPTHG